MRPVVMKRIIAVIALSLFFFGSCGTELVVETERGAFTDYFQIDRDSKMDYRDIEPSSYLNKINLDIPDFEGHGQLKSKWQKKMYGWRDKISEFNLFGMFGLEIEWLYPTTENVYLSSTHHDQMTTLLPNEEIESTQLQENTIFASPNIHNKTEIRFLTYDKSLIEPLYDMIPYDAIMTTLSSKSMFFNINKLGIEARDSTTLEALWLISRKELNDENTRTSFEIFFDDVPIWLLLSVYKKEERDDYLTSYAVDHTILYCIDPITLDVYEYKGEESLFGIAAIIDGSLYSVPDDYSRVSQFYLDNGAIKVKTVVIDELLDECCPSLETSDGYDCIYAYKYGLENLLLVLEAKDRTQLLSLDKNLNSVDGKLQINLSDVNIFDDLGGFFDYINSVYIVYYNNKIQSLNPQTLEPIWWIDLSDSDIGNNPRVIWCDWRGVLVMSDTKLVCYDTVK